MRGKWLAVVVLVVVLAVAAVVATLSRGGEAAPPKRHAPSVATQRFGDDADLMRRLERKKLVGQR